MPANYARIVRRSAAVAAVVAVFMVALSAILGGVPGLYGGLLAVAIVSVFFAISVVAVGYAARAGLTAMMLTAIATYTAKILILGMIISSLADATFFAPRLFALTAIACVLAWTGTQMMVSLRSRELYFEPSQGR